MEEKLHDLLYSTGVFSRYKGYDYFICAVKLAMENPERLKNINENIYQPIGNQFNTSADSVRRCIITIRNIFMENGGADLLTQMGGGTYWKNKNPYPKDMIDIFATYLQKNN